MSPALNRSSVIRCFERSDAIEIRDGIISTRDCHICDVYTTATEIISCISNILPTNSSSCQQILKMGELTFILVYSFSLLFVLTELDAHLNAWMRYKPRLHYAIRFGGSRFVMRITASTRCRLSRLDQIHSVNVMRFTNRHKLVIPWALIGVMCEEEGRQLDQKGTVYVYTL